MSDFDVYKNIQDPLDIYKNNLDIQQKNQAVANNRIALQQQQNKLAGENMDMGRRIGAMVLANPTQEGIDNAASMAILNGVPRELVNSYLSTRPTQDDPNQITKWVTPLVLGGQSAETQLGAITGNIQAVNNGQGTSFEKINPVKLALGQMNSQNNSTVPQGQTTQDIPNSSAPEGMTDAQWQATQQMMKESGINQSPNTQGTSPSGPTPINQQVGFVKKQLTPEDIAGSTTAFSENGTPINVPNAVVRNTDGTPRTKQEVSYYYQQHGASKEDADQQANQIFSTSRDKITYSPVTGLNPTDIASNKADADFYSNLIGKNQENAQNRSTIESMVNLATSGVSTGAGTQQLNQNLQALSNIAPGGKEILGEEATGQQKLVKLMASVFNSQVQATGGHMTDLGRQFMNDANANKDINNSTIRYIGQSILARMDMANAMQKELDNFKNDPDNSLKKLRPLITDLNNNMDQRVFQLKYLNGKNEFNDMFKGMTQAQKEKFAQTVGMAEDKGWIEK